MNFSIVAEYFDNIEKTPSRLQMTQVLAELFSHATPREVDILCNLSLGQLYPAYKSQQFSIASGLMIKIIADVLSLAGDKVVQRAKELGDLGLLVEHGQWVPEATLTVGQVYDRLIDITAISGTGSQDEKIAAVRDLLLSLDALSAKFVVRIIIGKLRLGFSDMTIVDALSWMQVGDKSLRVTIENAYNVSADIGYIGCRLKQDGIVALQQMKVKLGTPIRPASAERLPTATAIVEKIGPCFAQLKLDGFRLQIHVDNRGGQQKINFYSRNLQDMSAMFPDLVAALKKLPVESVIFEGEAIVSDPHTGTFLPFQETVKRKRKHAIDQAAAERPLQLYIFDLLYLNGQEFMSCTHVERRNQLEELFVRVDSDVVQIIEEKKIETGVELEQYFLQCIAAGLEGLVVKKGDSIYQPGKRNFNWIKLKRQEKGQLDDTIDCVILGYYAGRGKRAAFGIGAFLVGIYNKKSDQFETVAKIGTGLKDLDWIDLKARCDTKVMIEKPKEVVCAKDLYPDVWVAPEIVVMVRADEITVSPVHAAGKTKNTLGYALRFPRFMGYRPDKSALEATTDEEIAQLYQNQFNK